MLRAKEPARRLLAARPLQLNLALTLRLATEHGGFEALSEPADKVWCGKSQASSPGEEGMPPEDRQEVFRDPSQRWDDRRSTPNARRSKQEEFKVALPLSNWHKHTWMDSQLATWDAAGMNRPPECISTSGKGQASFVAHESRLEVGMCRQLCEDIDGRFSDAVDSLTLLVQRGCHVPRNLFHRVLKRCIALKDLVLGRRIHALTVESGYEGDAFLATHLIGLYASHGRLEEAMRVFSKVSIPTAYNWATIIFAYARHGKAAQAIRLYGQMREESTLKPDNRVYVAVLKACAAAGDLISGKEVHAHILGSPGKPDMFVETGLLDMYAKCGSLEDARRVFDSLPERNVVTWNTMLAGYAKQGMGGEAISLYTSMQQESIASPDSVTFVCLLQACAGLGGGALHHGKQLHAQVAERGLQDDVVLGGSLVNMYAKCGSADDARRVFDRLPKRNLVTWTAMIAGYAQQGMGQRALCLYDDMKLEGLSPPDSVTFLCLLQACASVGRGALRQGKELHADIEKRGLQADVVLGGSLVNMYAKCGSLEDARGVFDRLLERNVVAWNAMLAGYVQQEMGQEALHLYSNMQQEDITPPDSVTFACLLQACATLEALPLGKQLHTQIEERGLEADVVVGTCLIDMYAKCGYLEDARILFDRLPDRNVVTWNAMLAGYVQHGMSQEALDLYNCMQQEGLSVPDSVTFLCLLQACAGVGVPALHQGEHLHAQIEDQGVQNDVVLGGSLVNMYAKCGSLEDARNVFDRLPERNTVTWTAMIAGYVEQGMGQKALTLYSSMQQEGITAPDSVTFVFLLEACAIVASLPLGKQLHAQIEERGFQADLAVGAALVNMYAKCGSMVDSQQVFDSLPEKTLEAWGALTDGYTRQGDSEAVFEVLDRMRLDGIQPNGRTFVSVLTVCSHVGLVDKGRKYFESMTTVYGMSPTVEHYTCMMDLVGRAGHLDEALQVARTMPFPPTCAMWRTLLGACQKWNNVEIGEQAFQFAVSLDGKDAASYVMMSNIYASAQMWDEAKEMQAKRVKCGAWKEPGQSWWTDMGGTVHTFVAGDKKTS